MTDFRFSEGRKTNGPLIHALKSICDASLTIVFFVFEVNILHENLNFRPALTLSWSHVIWSNYCIIKHP